MMRTTDILFYTAVWTIPLGAEGFVWRSASAHDSYPVSLDELETMVEILGPSVALDSLSGGLLKIGGFNGSPVPEAWLSSYGLSAGAGFWVVDFADGKWYAEREGIARRYGRKPLTGDTFTLKPVGPYTEAMGLL